jgi:16S rRNA (guanine527-N7)-methyltransferase
LRDTVELLVKGADALGIQLDATQTDQFRRYYEQIVEWNERVNLTRITDWEQVQVHHFLDSLSIGMVLSPTLRRSNGRVLDVGSGAGVPGVPLMIAFPGLQVTLLEATAKKAKFLAHVAEELSLSNLRVCTGRAESLAHHTELRESFDAVVSKAVAKLNVLAELTLAFCRVGGVVVAQKGLAVHDEVQEADRAIGLMGGETEEVREITLLGATGPRSLVVIRKSTATPDRYPRRPGMPAKRPL